MEELRTYFKNRRGLNSNKRKLHNYHLTLNSKFSYNLLDFDQDIDEAQGYTNEGGEDILGTGARLYIELEQLLDWVYPTKKEIKAHISNVYKDAVAIGILKPNTRKAFGRGLTINITERK